MNVPLFPLPNVVFFPETFLPLEVFEVRYLRLLRDVMEGERLLLVALAREERPAGRRPTIHQPGTIARVEVVQPLDGIRRKILLRGLARARARRLREEPAGYWSGELQAIGTTLPDLQDPEVAERKARFLLTARRYGEQVLKGRYASDYLHDAIPWVTLVNRAASWLRTGTEEKQRWLAMNSLERRARAVERRMREQIDAHAAVEVFEERRPERPGAN
ncbi:MAG: LON peptidase substrate-binding domain-containing protein [Gemmatimonadota bacterium]|nr:LON peptidase substrate-binding domain-containing protein [Gemmatimonadota bacterium]